MMRRFAIIVLVGCTQAPAPTAPVVAPPLFTASAGAFGPLTANTPATLAALRRALAGYTVAPINTSEGLEYRVSRAGTRLFDVIPDETGTILNIHIVTPEVALGGHDAWRVGAPIADVAALTTCECWGDQTVCFAEGEHVAVGLTKICREGSARKALATGASPIIRTTIWSARPLVPGGHAAGGD